MRDWERYVRAHLSLPVVTLLAAAGLLVAVVFASGWLPARRASRVDPMQALRYE